ncbi:MAG: glycosyltransferase family 9 protein [Planctomycetota bacterium]|nr:glycosyltransferase family 9 protein [Planctomycetota bacterium]
MPPQRILLIRPSALGDVARTVPVLVSLRDAFPGAHIDWLVQDTFADVVRAHPALSGVVPFPRREFRLSRPARVVAFLRSLRARRYDVVIDAQGLARSGLMTLATGAPHRVGHADAREGARLAYTRRVPGDIETHTVDRMLTLARAAGAVPRRDALAMRLFTPPEARGAHLAHGPLASGRYAVLAPTSRWPAKQWADDRFAALARVLADAGTPVALVGGGSERAQVPACLALAQRHPRVVDLLGRTSIAQLMGIIEHASLVVANDSAALHMAVGFDRPLVALFGPTRVHRVGPYRRAGDVIQHASARDRFSHKDAASRALMERITLAEVVQACRRRLA